RQRAESGRRAGQHPGARHRHPGDLPADLRHGEAGIPHASGLSGHRTAGAAVASGSPMLSPIILVPAILHGLLPGGVSGLAALGPPPISGLLHIIISPPAALPPPAMFAAFFAHRLLKIDPSLAALGLTPLFFAVGYCLQRFVIGPAAH